MNFLTQAQQQEQHQPQAQQTQFASESQFPATEAASTHGIKSTSASAQMTPSILPSHHLGQTQVTSSSSSSAMEETSAAAIINNTQRHSAIVLNEIGTKLFTAGQHNDAMIIYDTACQVLKSIIVPSKNEAWTNPLVVLAAQRAAWGQQRLEQAEGAQETTASGPTASGNASSADEQDKTFQDHPLDVYQEGECDVGPRPFRSPLHIDLDAAQTTRDNLLEAMILFNRALVQHCKSQLEASTVVYENALLLVNLEVKQTGQCMNRTAHLGMLIHNNLGQINYVEGDQATALENFIAALTWAKQINGLGNDNEYRLSVASILSNCCRTQWMTTNTSDDSHRAFDQVLKLRSSVLSWDHKDVAAAHYNMGIIEYARSNSKQALFHLEHYLKIDTHRISQNQSSLDVIPALVHILLIQNEDSTETSSVELTKCLRFLQDKREDLGAFHTEVATLLNYIGALLFQRRELDHAIHFYQEELRVEQKLVGGNKSSTPTQKHPEQSLENAAPAESSSDGDAPLSLAVTLNNIGRIQQERGRYREAIHFYKRALTANKHNSAEDIASAASLANGNNKDGESSSSVNLFATIWYNLGLIHDMMDSQKDAIRSFQMSLALRRALLGSDHPDVACLWYNIGTLQMESQNLVEASASLKESLRIRRLGARCPQNDMHIITALQKLASLHQNRGNIDGAIEAFQEVIQIQQQQAQVNKEELGSFMKSVSELFHAKGDVESALQMASQSYQVYNSIMLEEAKQSRNETTMATIVEHVGTALLLLGSLYHEKCEPMLACAAYREAGNIIATVCSSVDEATRKQKYASLIPLMELSTMLACSHCAPEA
jgi:tetratricopeptide (TPR) repeat protein|eukprot:CAMPEP_0195261186 /NCGR_PEP_ID=MMETSP0706-20130129/9003_1 /TAXON_ID=33640 /ORGANISM="Asterionellopsis glacialis, Strain CCMP134" /LENGTH=831 /DNA_ID=CAMNT_0040315015 /DNA_START=54 /DNA_END=2549 /DNA_ORIENTATION=-